MSARTDSAAFLSVFREALASVPADAPWTGARERTRIMLGAGSARDGSVVFRTLESLGYRHGTEGHGRNERVLAFEWNGKDAVAVSGLGAPWGPACWRGRYRYDVVCEVENRLAEFELTMRGMFDIRARLSVGVFYADCADPDMGQGTWDRSSNDRRPLSTWSPPAGGTEDFPWRFAEGDEVLLLLLSSRRPVILTARAWASSGLAWKPLPVGEE